MTPQHAESVRLAKAAGMDVWASSHLWGYVHVVGMVKTAPTVRTWVYDCTDGAMRRVTDEAFSLSGIFRTDGMRYARQRWAKHVNGIRAVSHPQ